MQLIVLVDGRIRYLYQESLDLSPLGEMTITRASHLEPDESAQWWADLGRSSGPRIGPFSRRSAALQAEQSWLEGHLLS